MIPFAYYKLIEMIQMVWDVLPVWRQFCVILAAIIFAAVAVLNYYWYYWIVVRALQVMGLCGFSLS